MNKTKGKGGTGRGTGKKGWNRWKASANRAKSAKPYVSKGAKKSDVSNSTSSNKADTSE
ncbi:DUF3934 family protein [Bacillus sp. USDA818B3_A]|uniref:DUF3934 family protein n=1 Tax=Bacillus sp. USDA818B3_A TaxID=2698834 RepID=UPI001370FBB3|nr:DUF3934 family protein [Bacillus sp. USDA818B3_A]